MRIPLLLLLVSLAVCAAEPDVESLMTNCHWKRARALAGQVIGDKQPPPCALTRKTVHIIASWRKSISTESKPLPS